VDRKLINVTNGTSMPGPVPYFLGLDGFWLYCKEGLYGLTAKNRRYGPVVRVFVGPFVWILVTDYDSLYTFYSKSKSFQRGVFNEALGYIITPGALFATEGNEWRRHRLVMNQFFSEEGFIPLCRDYLEIAKEEYDALEFDKPFKIHEWADYIYSRILVKSLFNISVNRKNEEEMKRLDQATHVLSEWIISIMLLHFLCPALTKTRIVRKYVDSKIRPFFIFLQQMKDCSWTQITQNGQFTRQEFENESLALLSAGFEPSTNTQCYIFQCLSQNPDVRNKLKNELDTVLSGRPPTYDDLKNLPYLDKVILECLRLHPVFQLNSRKAVEQDTLGDYIIPKGYQIWASPSYVIKHIVNDPDTFNPDRYNDENIKELSKKILAGFGLGPHTCIGKQMALLELKIVTAYITQIGIIEVDTNEYKHHPHFPVKAPKNLIAVKKSHPHLE
jgi:cytochrome P450